MVASQVDALPFQVMTRSAPWSATLRLRTLPMPQLYDVRGRLIAELREIAPTERFRVRDDDVSVVFEGPREVFVGGNGITVVSFVDEDDSFRDGVLECMHRLLAPDVHSFTAGFQHIMGFERLPAGLREAVESGHALIGDLASRLGLTDYALLVDGVEQVSGREYQVEFGIIDAEEAPMRLARFAGRLSGFRPNVLEGLVTQEYPDVAVFVDSTWPCMDTVTLQNVAELSSVISILEGAANRLALTIAATAEPNEKARG